MPKFEKNSRESICVYMFKRGREEDSLRHFVVCVCGTKFFGILFTLLCLWAILRPFVGISEIIHSSGDVFSLLLFL